MPYAIVLSAIVLGIAYVLPKWWMIKAQENLVKLQIDQLSGTTTGYASDGQTEFSMDGPYS